MLTNKLSDWGATDFLLECRGTVNEVLKLGDGSWLVGVDSLSSSRRDIDGIMVNVPETEDNLKLYELGNGIVLTASGKASRCVKIHDHLKDIAGQGFHDLRTVFHHIVDYLEKNSVCKEDEVTMFLVGKDANGQVSTYLVGDRDKDFTPVKGNYHAIGSGGPSAMEALRNLHYKQDTDMTNVKFEDAVRDMFRALLRSTTLCSSCGGALRVWHVRPDSAVELPFPKSTNRHCIDVALHLGLCFRDRELFILDKSSYENMNHHILMLHLTSLLGYKVYKPVCYGFIYKAWKLYKVDLKSAEELKNFFESQDICSLVEFRKITFINGDVQIPLFVAPATQKILKAARNTTLLETLS